MKTLALALMTCLAACSSAPTPVDGGTGGSSGGSGGGDVGGGVGGSGGSTGGGTTQNPDAGQCAPTGATISDAGPATTTGACLRDSDCTDMKYCYAPNKQCVLASVVGYSSGPGRGGHDSDGSACAATLTLPETCEALALDWSPSVNVSREAASFVESDTVIAADGHGNVLAAWAQILNSPSAVSQGNRLAISHDDGATFTLVAAPTDSATSAANDPVLDYTEGIGWTLVWEGYASNFQGKQHVFSSTSTDGTTWSPAVQVDAVGDDFAGGALDFPWVSRSPVDHRLYVTYQASTSSGIAKERLVISQDDGGFGPSVEVDDGGRPSVYRDLATHTFDSAGSLYVAWLELPSQPAFGGQITGNVKDGVYVTRADPDGDGGLVFTRPEVKATGSDLVTFDSTFIATSPDGGSVFVTWVSGKSNATDVRVAVSHDRGLTFGAPVTVNDDTGCATHFHPSLVVDAKGRLWVIWYDNRDGQGHVFYSVSDDDGATFRPNRLVSAPSFPFITLQYSTGWLGDYFKPWIAGNELYVLMSDGREGGQSHAYFTHATLPQ